MPGGGTPYIQENNVHHQLTRSDLETARAKEMRIAKQQLETLRERINNTGTRKKAPNLTHRKCLRKNYLHYLFCPRRAQRAKCCDNNNKYGDSSLNVNSTNNNSSSEKFRQNVLVLQ